MKAMKKLNATPSLDPLLLPLLELLKTKSKTDLLFQFSKEDNLKFVKYLIENEAEVNAKNE